jgi:hypothetical protein
MTAGMPARNVKLAQSRHKYSMASTAVHKAITGSSTSSTGTVHKRAHGTDKGQACGNEARSDSLKVIAPGLSTKLIRDRGGVASPTDMVNRMPKASDSLVRRGGVVVSNRPNSQHVRWSGDIQILLNLQ